VRTHGWLEGLREFAIVCAALWLAGATAENASALDTGAGERTATKQKLIADAPPADLSSLEADLRSTNFDRRQRAMLRLWGGRDEYREWVEAAVDDADPEVARRASWVLNRWRRGLLPDTPRDIADRLEGVSGPDTVENLLNLGLFTGAVVAIDEAIGGATSPAVIDRAKAAVRRRFPFYVRIAAEQNQLPELVAVLDRIADDAPMTLSFQQLNRLVNTVEGNPLPRAAERWTESQRQKIGVILHAASGDLDQAIQSAKMAADPELLRVCRMLAGDWPTLAKEQVDLANAETAGSLEWYRHWMYALIAASRANDDSIREEAIARLSQPRGEGLDTDLSDPINRIRWQALAMHGEIDAAVSILKPLQPNDAAELLAQAGRHIEAFDAIDVDWQDLDAEIAMLTKDAIRAERSEANLISDQGSPELMRLLAAVRLLVSIGRDDLALYALKTVVDSSTQSRQDGVGATRIEAIRTISRINRNDWIIEVLPQSRDITLSGRTQFFVALVFDSEMETVGALIEAFGRLRPGSTYVDRVRDTVAILNGKLPDHFEQSKDLDTLLAAISSSRRVIRRKDGGMMVANVPRVNLDMARIFELHNRPDLSKQVLVTLAANGEPEATLRLATSELNEGSVQNARRSFAQVWEFVNTSGQDTNRLNRADGDALVAMKAIQGEAIAARRLGDSEGAEQLQQLIRLMSCTPSAALRKSFAEHLVEQGMNEQAEEMYRPLLHWVAFGSDEGVEFYSIARDYDSAVSETAPKASAAAIDLAIAGTIETTVFYPAAYVSLPSYVHRRMIRNAVSEKNEQAVRREIDKLLRLDPIDIDFGEKVLESMREAGMKDVALEVLERIYQAGAEHLANFPQDVGMSNNLAWVMALSDFRLEDALLMSKRAVFYEPDSTVYRDTLAEVLYRLGRVDEAIAIEKACLLDQPAEWHVHQQIRRFELGEKSPRK
jgi:tetratricopeptide (TPR) repeat protein